MTHRPQGSDLETAVADAHRRGWALVVAATVRVARDLDLAEDCAQEAYAAALATWSRDGIPSSPIGWLITTARRRAIDVARREQVLRSKLPLLLVPVRMVEVIMEEPTDDTPADSGDPVPDERLRLIFMCCHPALSQEAQLALTLRLVCGLSTRDVARALLVSESTMAARLTRAKKKISTARIPFRVPPSDQLSERLRAVLGVIHLLFTAGHTAPSGESLVRVDLMDEALRLARMLRQLMPGEREVWGLLALILVTGARRSTRVAKADGRLLRLRDQDRTQWDRAAIAEADTLVSDGLRAGPPGRYLLQAAIATLYAEAPTYEDTDWAQIVVLHDALLAVWPSSVVALNRSVALAEVAGPLAALAEIERLELGGDLHHYQYLPAVKADLLRRVGRTEEAAVAYARALELTDNEAERAFLAEQLEDLHGGDGSTTIGVSGRRR